MKIGDAETRRRISAKWVISILIFIGSIFLFNNISVQPFRGFGGVVWFQDGLHYMSESDVDAVTTAIQAPYEQGLLTEIIKDTPMCSDVKQGYCQRTTSDFQYKSLNTPAVEYKPAIPDKKEVVGYCTLCNDGTWSPSCAVGRGACSWHGGVNAYNVARYRIIPGTPAVAAKAATYNYSSRSYKDSVLYIAPDEPTLQEVVNYFNQ